METKILIGLTTGEIIRHSSFLPSFVGLHRPANSITCTIHGQSPAAGRNLLIRQALDNNCTHIFFMDDDMVFPQDTLKKLLMHDKDIISALYLLRGFPHRAAFFDRAYSNGKCKFTALTPGLTGLVKGVNAGLGACLIKTSVFKSLEEPWVRLGQIKKDEWCDDIEFFNRCREAGYDIWCDLDCRVGHMTTTALWPEYVNGEWFATYKYPDGNIQFPQNIPTEEQIREEEDLAITK